MPPCSQSPLRSSPRRHASTWRRWLARFALLAFAACSTPRSGPGPVRSAAPAPSPIVWLDFTPAAFDQAKREHKLILLSVQAGFCHWCHVMNATTYQDPRVVQLLGEGFVAIRVDQDAHPELKQRYLAWGWPATALLTSDAESIVNLRGHQPAGSFAKLLSDLHDQQKRGLTPRALAKQASASPSDVTDTQQPDADLAQTRDAALAQLDSYYDDAQGGWGKPQKYPFSAPVQHALFRAAVHDESTRLAHALTTLHGHRALIDPVAGGMFQYSLRNVSKRALGRASEAWTAPHFEKLASIQAGALQDFSSAYAATGDPAWLRAAELVASYVVTTLRDPSGAFYASQAADVGLPGQPGHLEGARYYALSTEQRAGIVAPDLDRHIYADLNGMLIQGLCALYRVSGDERWRSAARAASRAVTEELARGPLFAHQRDQESGAFYLSDQVEMVAALDALASVSLEEEVALAEMADRTLSAARVLFEDAKSGGFYARTAQPGARGVFRDRLKPMHENAVLARLLLMRGHRNDEASLREDALRTLRSLATAEAVSREGRNIGDYLLALEHASSTYVMLSVVGPRTDPRTKSLIERANTLFLPQGFVSHSEPGEGRYPYPGQPAVYLCSDNACSSPISESEALKSSVESFVADGS